jgi:hypothetical protein
LDILDISNPVKPRRTGSIFSLDGYALDFSISGNYAYVKYSTGQLKRYSRDEKFLIKVIGETTLKKVVLIFSGTRLVYHGEIN